MRKAVSYEGRAGKKLHIILFSIYPYLSVALPTLSYAKVQKRSTIQTVPCSSHLSFCGGRNVGAYNELLLYLLTRLQGN